jgi:hypothetical protein
MSDHLLTEEFRIRTPKDGEWMHTAAEIRAGLADGSMNPEWPARREDTRDWSTLGELHQWIQKEEARRARRAKELLAQNPPPDALCKVRNADREDGPFLPEQIRHMWKAGQIKADATYTFDALGEWFPVQNIMKPPAQRVASPNSDKPKRSPVAIALFAAGVALFAVFSAINSPSSKRTVPEQITKSEWRSRVQGIRFGQIYTTKSALVSAVGEPSQTQTVGNSTYLYWNCSDGTIQVVCNRGAFDAGGQIIGTLNDY